jgi:hypothetical protein
MLAVCGKKYRKQMIPQKRVLFIFVLLAVFSALETKQLGVVVHA